MARHQVQEIAVHTYDAQLAIGAPQPLPDEVALDGVDEFLFTCAATTFPWPHERAVVGYHASGDRRSWLLWLSAEGARAERTSGIPEADVLATGTASDLVLTFYGRNDLGGLRVLGDRGVLNRLVAWEPR